MGIILSIQLSAFSNKRIIPSADNISIIMPKLKEISGIEFLPNIVNTQKIDIATGNIEEVPNLSFVSINKKSQVICSENRIDCSFSFELDQKEAEVFAKFDTAAAIIVFIMGSAKVIANRLALNIDFLSNICDGNTKFETQVMKVVPFYSDKDIKEWSSRTNAKGIITINGVNEDLNIITEYTHTKEPVSGETRIVCHSDINTVAENRDYRFDHNSIQEFKAQAKEIFLKIQSDLSELVD